MARRRQGFGEGFALLAECLLTGAWLVLAALPVVTLPAALSAASRHVAAYVDGESTGWGAFWKDFRVAWRESWRAGLAVVGAGVLLLLNLLVLAQEGVPGRPGFALATFAVAGLAATVLLRAAAAWTPGRRWRSLLTGALDEARGDASGTAILLGGMVVLAACTWALWLLVVPMSGCLIGAAVAVRRRRIGREAEEHRT